MAREVIFKDWCDVCLGEGDQRVEGKLTPLLHADDASRAKPRRLTLCPQHWDALWEPVRVALTEHGQADDEVAPTVQPPRRSHHAPREPGEVKGVGKNAMYHIPGPFVCPVPGCTQRNPAKNYGSFSQHVYARHGVRITEYRQQYGEPERVDGSRAPSPAEHAAAQAAEVPADAPAGDDPYRCPVADCPTAYTARGLKDPLAGLRMHKHRRHPDLWALDKARERHAQADQPPLLPAV